MDKDDDDEMFDWFYDDRRAAYERIVNDLFSDVDDYEEPAGVDPATYIEFANIVQHYDATAVGTHDDIEFDDASVDNLDGAETDQQGRPVINYGIMLAIVEAIEEFGSFSDIPDDYEFLVEQVRPEDDGGFDRGAYPGWRRFGFPFYDPRKGHCKGHRAFFPPFGWFGQPPV